MERFARALRNVASILPLFLAACQSSAQSPTWDFDYPKDALRPGALLDLRYLNEKVAGESGFLKLAADGESFVLGNGKPVRFWATVSDGYRLKPEQMEEHARWLAKLGVNMVRLHTQIAPNVKGAKITEPNEEEIDRIWRYVSVLKKQGIYATISPYWATAKETQGWGLVADYTGTSELWGMLFFDERLQAGYKAWVKALYSPKNPYTGIPLAQDPAVGIIQVQNEDGLFFWTTQGMKPQGLALLGRKFAAWATKKYGSLEAARQKWSGAAAEGDQWASGQLGIYPTWMLTQDQTGAVATRVTDQVQFFAESQFAFYRMIGDYYRKDLGCQQLQNASNWVTADPIRLNDLERYTNSAMDVLAINRYYDGGVHLGEYNGWRIDPGHKFGDVSALRNPRDIPTNLKQVVGHPMTITESSWVSPLGYQSEGPFAMAAYQSLTGVDTYYWFASGGVPQFETEPYFTFANLAGGQHPMNKWSCATPALAGAFPANALTYRLGYVKPGPVVIHEERPLADLYARIFPTIAEDKTFDPNRNAGTGTEQSNIPGGVNPLAFLVGRVETKYGGDASRTKGMNLRSLIDAANSTVKSATGEINLNYGLGILTVDTPKAQGVSGFLSRGKIMKLGDVTINSRNEYATIQVVAMDDQPIATSGRLLVQVVTVCRPTGWAQKPATFKSEDGKQTFQGFEVVNTGKMPYQLTVGNGTMQIRNSRVKKALVLDGAGFLRQTVPLARADGKVSLAVPKDALYVILAE